MSGAIVYNNPIPAKNFKLIIEYDGTYFHGWQKQKADRTVQGEIEKKISLMTRQKITLNGSGRTDAGVHAKGQVANFRCQTKLGAETLRKGLNRLLPDDICIRTCERVDLNFHARFDAKEKTYQYTLYHAYEKLALGRQYAWVLNNRLNRDAMRKAAANIIGEHDFKSFEGAGSPRQHSVRFVRQAQWDDLDRNVFRFSISANGFLRFMVRNIVGTLVYVGLNRLTPEDVRSILKGKDRSLAPPTAPPQGLCLIRVRY